MTGRVMILFLTLGLCRAAAQDPESWTTLRGDKIHLSQFEGRFLLLLFSGEDSKQEAKDLLRNHAEELLPLEHLVVLSVIDPGSGARMTSRGALTGRVRKEIDRENERILASLPDTERTQFLRLPRHEVIDWEGRLTERYQAPVRRVGLLLLAPDGTIARPAAVADAATLRGLLRLVAMGPVAYRNAQGRGERIERLLENIEGK